MDKSVFTSTAAKEKGRILLAGGWERMIENLTESLEERYQIKQGPSSPGDFKKVLANLRPHVIVVCLSEESGEVLRLRNILEEPLKASGLPVIIIGQEEDCIRFKQKVLIPGVDACPRPLEMSAFLELLERRVSAGRQLLEVQMKERIDKARQDAAQIAASASAAPAEPGAVVDHTKAAAAAARAAAAAKDPAERRLMYEIEKLTMAHGRKSVLVVDDDVRMLNVVKLYLQDLYDVTVVPSGKLALKFLTQKHADMVLLDYMMQEMDGPEVLRRIREETPVPNIPVVFLTGVSEKDMVMRGIELAPRGYLLKPVTRMGILEKVTEVLLGLV